MATGWLSCVTHRLAVSYRVAELCYTQTGSLIQGDLAVLHRLPVGYRVTSGARQTGSWLQGVLAVLHRHWLLVTG